MPQLAPSPLHLTEMEREQLQQLVNRHSTPEQIALRASIILLADAGLIASFDVAQGRVVEATVYYLVPFLPLASCLLPLTQP